MIHSGSIIISDLAHSLLSYTHTFIESGASGQNRQRQEERKLPVLEGSRRLFCVMCVSSALIPSLQRADKFTFAPFKSRLFPLCYSFMDVKLPSIKKK